MKTLFKPLLLLAVAIVSFSSCMKDTSAEDEAEQRRIEEIIFAQLEKDTEEIQDFTRKNPSDAPGGWKKDDTDQSFPILNKRLKRGYYFEVLADPIPEEGKEEYKYKLIERQTSYNLPVALPKVTVTYSVSSLDGKEYQSGEKKEIDLATFPSNNTVFNYTWYYSFIPKMIEYNEREIEVGGLTTKGLRKGSKIRVLAPSLYTFGDKKNGDIPANTPLVYEFEVLEIE